MSVCVCAWVCVCVCVCVSVSVCDLTGFSTQTTGSPEPTTATLRPLNSSKARHPPSGGCPQDCSSGKLSQVLTQCPRQSQDCAWRGTAPPASPWSSPITDLPHHRRTVPSRPYHRCRYHACCAQRSARPPLCLPLLAILRDSAVVHRRDQPAVCHRLHRVFWTPRNNRLLYEARVRPIFFLL